MLEAVDTCLAGLRLPLEVGTALRAVPVVHVISRPMTPTGRLFAVRGGTDAEVTADGRAEVLEEAPRAVVVHRLEGLVRHPPLATVRAVLDGLAALVARIPVGVPADEDEVVSLALEAIGAVREVVHLGVGASATLPRLVGGALDRAPAGPVDLEVLGVRPRLRCVGVVGRVGVAVGRPHELLGEVLVPDLVEVGLDPLGGLAPVVLRGLGAPVLGHRLVHLERGVALRHREDRLPLVVVDRDVEHRVVHAELEAARRRTGQRGRRDVHDGPSSGDQAAGTGSAAGSGSTRATSRCQMPHASSTLTMVSRTS